MLKVDASAVIHRPIAEVFAYVTDLNTHAQWQAGLIEAKQTSAGPTQVGATYKYTMQLAGQKLETVGQVTEFEPNSKYAFKSTSGPIPLKGEFTFESAEGGTHVRMSAEGEPGGFFKLAEPLLNNATRQQIETSLANLKKLLEAR
jgi:uncharacterized membrane protein